MQTNDNEKDFAAMEHPASKSLLTSAYQPALDQPALDQPALDQPAGVRVCVVHPTNDAQQASAEKLRCERDSFDVEVQVGTISFSFTLIFNVVIRLLGSQNSYMYIMI